MSVQPSPSDINIKSVVGSVLLNDKHLKKIWTLTKQVTSYKLKKYFDFDYY